MIGAAHSTGQSPSAHLGIGVGAGTGVITLTRGSQLVCRPRLPVPAPEPATRTSHESRRIGTTLASPSAAVAGSQLGTTRPAWRWEKPPRSRQRSRRLRTNILRRPQPWLARCRSCRRCRPQLHRPCCPRLQAPLRSSLRFRPPLPLRCLPLCLPRSRDCRLRHRLFRAPHPTQMSRLVLPFLRCLPRLWMWDRWFPRHRPHRRPRRRPRWSRRRPLPRPQLSRRRPLPRPQWFRRRPLPRSRCTRPDT